MQSHIHDLNWKLLIFDPQGTSSEKKMNQAFLSYSKVSMRQMQ